MPVNYQLDEVTAQVGALAPQPTSSRPRRRSSGRCVMNWARVSPMPPP